MSRASSGSMAIIITCTRTKAILLLCLALFNASPAKSRSNSTSRSVQDSDEKVFNVLDYGAKMGDKEVRTEDGEDGNRRAFVHAFQAACQHPGKARLIIPRGTFVVGPVTFMGPCKNTAPLSVHIQATIKASTDISLYPGEGEEWINFNGINGLIVTGTGTLDGQGPAAWKYRDSGKSNDDPGQRLPANILFFNVQNAIIRGITSLNSKGFHYFITQCQNIRLAKIRITAPADSPNTDGIHISQSNSVNISKSVIGTGDDCVGMIQGSNNVTIKKVTCGPGHGISVGSLGRYKNEADVQGIIVKDCTLLGTENGLRIKTNVGKTPSQARSMVFQNILMRNVRNPIIIDQFYESEHKDSIIKISDIRFINITGTSVSEVAVDLACSKQTPCTDVHLSNINLRYSGNQSNVPFSSSCLNAQVGTVVVQAKCRKCSSAHKSKSRPVPPPRSPPPHSPEKNYPEAIFHVTEYGAVADGETDSTSAFLKAWEAACDHAGSSTFYIPEGKFLVGPITFSGPCRNNQPPDAQIRGTLLAVPDLSAYPADDWIVFNNLHGFNLIGEHDEATLDGQGGLDAWKQESCVQSANCDRLITSVKFNNVSNGTISDISVTNSKAFHISFNNCDRMDMNNVNIKAPGDSPNTDGIHVHESTNINIVSADIGVGDDCVSIGPGSINISVSDIRCGPGHGISVGSLGKYQNEADVVGVVIRNSIISNTQNGVRVKTWPGSPASVASNFTFEDIVMINVSNPIIIDQEYCPSGSCEEYGPSKVKISNMYFKNITGTYNTPTGVSLLCSSGVPCENIHLADINMQFIKRETPGQGHFSVKGVVHGLEILTSSF
ncbi:hypothetical protein Patl1_24992 [Pistacia atlantica]|uniref:Uncharacterized protein n=1 Tax=Pistacia atlantica TaxID=434234 RepID=A0ACC1B149_9ROSI|nr:hypothetical protein Patl1_24992 [Pistacia atlantica]